MKTFSYQKSRKIIQWGCDFDSLLEFKYALSIKDDYDFLRSHIPIYYDPRDRIPTNYIRDNIRRYTPDFLIRHKVNKSAFLVEVKPSAFEGQEQLELRRDVAENYIRRMGYDWQFKIVYSNDIKLTPEQQAKFNQCCKMLPVHEKKQWFKEMNKQFNRSQSSLFTRAPTSQRIRFVMFGAENCVRHFV